MTDSAPGSAARCPWVDIDGERCTWPPHKGNAHRLASIAGQVWCPCLGTPEPPGPWVYPDDTHADTCHYEYGVDRRAN